MDLTSAQLHSNHRGPEEPGKPKGEGRQLPNRNGKFFERQTYSAVLMRKVACDIGRFDGFCFLKTAIGYSTGARKRLSN